MCQLIGKLKQIFFSVKDYAVVFQISNILCLMGKRKYTFIDLFAGAGGFSEGFLQAVHDDKQFEFVLASDINENCELTHLARYNEQLGLNAAFLKQDITDPNFLRALRKEVGKRSIDVVCGGPPCQSFSLAGKRRYADKKDDLFRKYLEVIHVLRPKYFIMENVAGILTKDKGRVKHRIASEINGFLTFSSIKKLCSLVQVDNKTSDLIAVGRHLLIVKLIDGLPASEKAQKMSEEHYRLALDRIKKTFKSFTTAHMSYENSKSNRDANSIRHGINLLEEVGELKEIRESLIALRHKTKIDNDFYVEDWESFIGGLSVDGIIEVIQNSLDQLKGNIQKDGSALLESLCGMFSIFKQSWEGCIEFEDELSQKKIIRFLDVNSEYKLCGPFLLNSKDFGVPQNRKRVVFIGVKKGQKLVLNFEKSFREPVVVEDALGDLQGLRSGGETNQYAADTHDMTAYIKQSRNGRLGGVGFDVLPPKYYHDLSSYRNSDSHEAELHNHRASKQSEDVRNRLSIIIEEGGYKQAKNRLEEVGLISKKRNYNLLNPASQSPTVVTLPDDFIHYSEPRSLTVREMARLQSFDDDFVFQGKRSTGGDKRSSEVPQYTLVGNAVPPLMAKGIALEILRNIK